MSFAAAGLAIAIADDVPFDPWDERTPEERAAYDAELDRVAELSQGIPFSPDEESR